MPLLSQPAVATPAALGAALAVTTHETDFETLSV